MSRQRVQPRELPLAPEAGVRTVANMESHVSLAVVLTSEGLAAGLALKRSGGRKSEREGEEGSATIARTKSRIEKGGRGVGGLTSRRYGNGDDP